ncbi:NAD(P)H-dependent oxidoreductase [uncultured Leclercia sp.]|uniref:NADPH-dependent FMN reductase n=1 Tax=uncultured Leclercia sp. TaxID=332959 RepID=UPI0025927D94|nr:NAD(P)H-dependent oxidoreductase [uncultured Leclercia sp.]
MKKILALSGSSARQSVNRILLEHVTSKMTKSSVTLFDLSQASIPLYSVDQEAEKIPDDARKLWAMMCEHDAVVIASPEHNGLMPAALKNAVDWLSRLRGPGESFFGHTVKPVLLISTSPGANGGATALRTMQTLMPWWGGDVRETYSLGNFFDRFSDNHFDAETEQQLSELADRFENAIYS